MSLFQEWEIPGNPGTFARRTKVPVVEWTRTSGQRLTYIIAYDHGEYFIQRDGQMKKAVPDAMTAGISSGEAKASLMLRMAIADIEALIGMDE